MPADLQKARELFLHAVGKLPPEQWQGYVAESCGSDAELEQQVGRLLQVHREAGSFLDRPAAALGTTGAFRPVPGEGAAAVLLRELPGTVIGPYKLLQQIGEGGMGTVFMAEQTQPVQRKVALKIIKPGMDSKQIIARFEAERQALAMMDHVNIARVLDAGATESGRPYFVMELVHGVPITKYCDDNRLTPRQRLELFVPVCQAIQHAHQKGIIHRDIKPSNILVTLYDGKPVPKVIDFGVAKATEQPLTERTLFTQYGTMVGTLEYMSPEQAEMSALGVDTRGDIFSLGVLLYELLTGSTPLSHKRLKEAAYGEILRMIKEEEAPRPSTRLSDSGEALASISANRHTEPAKLTKLVRGELDWIVMKTLEKDRNRRYETAKDFAADVQRYLNDEPVQACPPSAAYRFRKFARRNKRILATAGVIVMALVLGTAVSTWQAIRATQAEGLAQERLDTAEEQRQVAEAQHKLARRAVDRMFTLVADKWLSRRAHLEPLQRQVLEEALQFYQEFAKERSSDPAIRLETGNAIRRLSEIQTKLGESANAENGFKQALALLADLVTEYPAEPDYQVALAWAYSSYCSMLADANRLVEAEKAGRQALALRAELALQYPDRPDLGRDLFYGQHVLADVYFVMGRSEAEQGHRQALKSFENLPPSVAKTPECCLVASYSYRSLGRIVRDTGRFPEAEKLLNQAVAIDEKLASEFPLDPVYRHELALNLWSLQDPRPMEAERAYRRAVAIQEKLVAESPSVPEYRRWLGVFYHTLGEFLKDNGNPKEAEQVYRQGIDVFQKLAAASPKVADYPDQLGQLYSSSGQWDKAIVEYTQAIELKPDRWESWYRRGHAYWNQQLRDKALTDFSKAIDLSPQHPNPWLLADAWHHRSDIYGRLGRLDKEVAGYTTAIELAPGNWWHWLRRGQAYAKLQQWSKTVADCTRTIELKTDFAEPWQTRGDAHAALGQWDKAAQDYAKAIELNPAACAGLTEQLKAKGRLQEAEKLIRQAVTHFEKLAAANPKVADYADQLGQLYSSTGQWEKAIVQYTQAIELKPDRWESWFRRGDAYRSQELLDKALTDFSKAIDLNPQHANPWLLGDAWHHRADIYGHLGQVDKQVAGLTAAIELAPGNHWHWLRRGQVYARLQQWPKTVADCTRSIELKADVAEPWQTRGDAHAALGHWEKAVADYAKAIELNPAACAGLTEQLKAKGRLQEAEKLIRQAVAHSEKRAAAQPQQPAFKQELTKCYLELIALLKEAGKHKEAEQSQRDVLAIRQQLVDNNPAVPEYRRELAFTHRDLALALRRGPKRIKDAEDHHRQSLAILEKLAAEFPGDSRYLEDVAHTQRYLGFLLSNTRRFGDAEQAFTPAVKIFEKLMAELPNVASHRQFLVGTLQSLGNVQMADGRPVDAEKSFRQAIAVDSKNAAAHNNLAWLLATGVDPKFRDGKRAVELGKKAVELEPKQGMWWNTLGAAHYCAGNWKESIDALQKSMELRAGGDSFDWFFLAMAFWQLGNKDEGRKWYDKAVEWMEKNKEQLEKEAEHREELQRFRAEARDVLGLKDTSSSNK